MKRFLILFLLFATRAFSQAVPATYPYPTLLPTSGAMSGGVLVTGPLRPSNYADNRAVVWDDLVGGGFRSVQSIVERDSIINGRRKEGMWVFVSASSGDAGAGHIYALAADLVTWYDLGAAVTGSLANADTSIYKDNGILEENREISGTNSYSITFKEIPNYTITAGNLVQATSPNIYFDGTTSIEFNRSVSPLIFKRTPTAINNTEYITVKDPATGEFKTSTTTIASLQAGVSASGNIYTTNGTLAGNRTIAGGGFGLTITNVNGFSTYSTTNINSAATYQGLFSLGTLDATSVGNMALTVASGNLTINGTSTPYKFATSPSTAASGDYIMFRNSAGEVRYDATVTKASLAGATTLYSGSGSLSSDRTVNAVGYNLNITNLNNNYVTGTNLLYVGSTLGAFGGASAIFSGTTALSLQTPSIGTGATTTQPGQFLQLQNTTGGLEYAPVYYTSTTSGQTGSTYTFSNAQMAPDFVQTYDHPVGTVAYLTFNATSVGADAIKLGPSTTTLGIVHHDGSAIAAGELLADVPYTFVKVGTGGSAKWLLQGHTSATTYTPLANRSAVVSTVADLVALDPIRFNSAATKGYYVADDGGAGSYYWVSNQTSTNFGAKIASASSGSWVLLKPSVLSSKTYGITNSTTIDQTTRVTQFLAAAAGGTAVFAAGDVRVTSTITIPASTKVIAYGAIFDIEITGAYPGIAVNDNTSWEGGTVVTTGISGYVSGEDHTAFTIGDYTTGVGYDNVSISKVTVSATGPTPPNTILVTGDSSNIYLGDITVSSSATTACGILVHWGANFGAGNPSAVNPSKHPHNVTIERCNIGALTYPNATWGISLSGVYATTVRDCTVEQAHFGIDWVAGDYGFKYSGFTNATTLNGVSFNNCIVKKATGHGIVVDGGVELFTETSENFVTFNDCNVTGPSTEAALSGSTIYGVLLDRARHVEFRNTVVKGFQWGVYCLTNVQNITFAGGVISDNRINGAVINRSDTKHITFDGVSFERNGWGATSAAYGINILDGSYTVVKNCNFGDTITQDTIQELSIRIQQPAIHTTLINNHVSSQKATYVWGYNLGNVSHTNQLWLVSGNTADPAYVTTMYTGSPNIPIATRGGTKRIWTGTGVPTQGHYAAGDIMVIDNPQYGPSTLICTVAGSPGTWIASATADQPAAMPDADFTYTPGAGSNYYIELTAITANRVITLSSTGAYEGCKFTLVRSFFTPNPYYIQIVGNGTKQYVGQTIEFIYQNGSWRQGSAIASRDIPILAVMGDTSDTVYTYNGSDTFYYNTVLTADRTLTLSTSGVYSGSKFTVVRSAAATGAFNLTISGKVLAAGTWADFIYDTSLGAWLNVRSGSL